MTSRLWMRSDLAARLKRELRKIVATTLALGLALAPAGASETLTYSYDANGRLVKVAHSGTVNSSTSTCYSNDRADNRTNVAVSTTTACSSPTAAITFSVNDPPSVNEGTSLVFTVTKTGSGAATVDYATADGTAAAGNDYTTTSGTLSFTSAQTSKTVSVPTINDTVVDGNRTVLLNLANSSTGTAITDGQGVGTILDDDAACTGVSFSIATASAAEGSNVVLTVTKTGSTTASCSVSYASSSGTATSGTDFTATSGTLTFTSAQTSKTISVPTIDDTIIEGDETFGMTLSNPDKSGALGVATTNGVIVDNDQCRSVAFTISNNGAVNEGSGSQFTISKSGTSSYQCTVNYATANGTAVAPGDYAATSGTATFNSTDLTKLVTVPTYTDALSEGAETFTMTLSSPGSGATLGTPSSATGTINNVSGGGGSCSGLSYSVSDASIKEGNNLRFTVSATGTTSSSCNVNYATADGTYTAPGAYTSQAGVLTFSSTVTSQTVTVPTFDGGDCATDPPGTMYLNLSNAAGGAGIADAQGVGSIRGSDLLCGGGGTNVVAPGSPDGSTAPSDSSGDPASVPSGDSSTTTDPPPSTPQ